MSAGTERLQSARDGRVVGAVEQRLAHVRDVEQPGGGARVQVLGEDAGRILHRHVVAGERRHARAELDMQRVERRRSEGSMASVMGQPVEQSAPPQRRPQRRGLRSRRPLCPVT